MRTKSTLSNALSEAAVGYLRMSDDSQDKSIEQQRHEVLELAKRHNYTIVEWYVDSGKSGSKEIAKRKEFLRMVADSSQRKWTVILCWDVQRFGRLDPLKAAQYKDTLRDNGCHLHTVKEGIIRWEEFTDFVVDVVYAAAAHQYSKSLSKDSIRGRIDLLNEGQWPNGKVPFGYDRLYTSPEGKEFKIGRSENFKKARGWKRELVLNPSEAETVKWIYDQYLTHDLSLREIAKQISATRPDGKDLPWTKDTVKATLHNKIYCGFAYIGDPKRMRAKEVHNRFSYQEVAGAVPSVVTLNDYDNALAKLAGNKSESRKVQPSTSSPLSGALLLISLESSFVIRPTQPLPHLNRPIQI